MIRKAELWVGILETQYLSVVGGAGANIEPQALSSGGSLIYRSLTNDRRGDYFSTQRSGIYSGVLWSYDLDEDAPGYDEMWTILPGYPRHKGWYKGVTTSINGIYHNGGDQNPIIPYRGKLYTHRSNAIIAYGPGSAIGKVPLLTIQKVEDNTIITPSSDVLIGKLSDEIQKIISAGHLRPGYFNNGQLACTVNWKTIFENPGDTIYTLSIAYPYLSPGLQNQVKAYLKQEFQAYFDPIMFAKIGWVDGAAREAMPLPQDVQSAITNFPKSEIVYGFAWYYPQHNFYAMWKYALIFPEDAARIYDLAKSKLQIPVPEKSITTDYFDQNPFELNAYIAGYIGFLRLQSLAKQDLTDSNLKVSVTNELNRLISMRSDNFTKDTYWVEEYYHKRSLNVARNFMYLVPELGDYLNSTILQKITDAVNEYDYIAPYWFVSRYESAMNEGTISILYNYPAMFQAKAYILKRTKNRVDKIFGCPSFRNW